LTVLAAYLPVLALKAHPENLVIRYEGIRELSESFVREAAKRELDMLRKEAQKQAAADDAAFQMKLAYHVQGFPFADVNYRLEPGEPTEVVFIVHEGPRTVIQKVTFIGRSAFKREQLRPFFEPKRAGLLEPSAQYYSENLVQSAVAAIRELYLAAGYADVVFEEPRSDFSSDRTRVSITITLHEGTRYLIRNVEYLNTVLPESRPELLRLREDLVGAPYFKRREVVLKSNIQEIYGNRGYPEAQVEIERRGGQNPGDVVLAARMTSGPRIRIAGIQITGNAATKSSFIISQLRLHEGDVYILSQERESFRRLYATGLFSQVSLNLIPADGEPDKRLLSVHVTEVQRRSLSLVLGWGSYELLRGEAVYQEKNLFGTGRLLRTGVGASFKGESVYTSLTDPWFLTTDIAGDLSAFYRRREEPAFTRSELGAALVFSLEILRGLVINLGYNYRLNLITDIRADADLLDLRTRYNVAGITLKSGYDTRNDVFFPTSGQRSYITAEVTDPVIGGELSFYRITADTRWFFPLTQTTVLGARLGTGLIIPGLDPFLIPVSERFYLGGENTVRSFYESRLGPIDPSGDAMGGLAFNVFNLELRQRLYDNFIGTIFADFGNISPNRSRAQEGVPAFASRDELIASALADYFTDFRPAFGFGLGYLLPVGPARIDAAFNPYARAERKEPKYVILFSIGMAF